jgi:bifunctional non-homologous end joining protein LigD
MTIFDRGRYDTEKWRDGEVVVVLHGKRAAGRYVLFRTRGDDWMIHRMDGPPPGWTPMPELVAPMTATRARTLPTDDPAWGYELDWPGTRTVAYVSGGRLVLTAGEQDVSAGYPELRPLAEALAPVEVVLDGTVVSFAGGRIGPARPPVADTAEARRLATREPVQYLATDVLWLDGVSTVDEPYTRRRERLAGLDLAGPSWQCPPHFTGGGEFALDAAREQRVPGVLAKRLDSPYRPGRRTRDWLKIPAARRPGR